MSWVLIKQLREQRTTHLGEMRNILTTAEARPEAERDLTAEERAAFDGISAKAESLKTRIEDLSRCFDVGGDPAADVRHADRDDTDGDDDTRAETDEQREERAVKAFDTFLRTGRHTSGVERRDVVTSGMGVVGPRGFSGKLIDSMKYYAGVRAAGAQLFPTTDGNTFAVPTGDDTGNTGRLVAEAAANTNQTEPTLGVVSMSAYEIQSDWVKVSRAMLQDAAFDVVGYINGILAKRLGRKSNTYYTTGTGSGQPQGFVNATTGVTLASTTAITYDEWIDFQHSVDRAYRDLPTAAVQFHDTTLAALRKLKDGDNRYIWAAGLEGEPDKIAGMRYVVNNDMAVPAASAKIAVFGDWNAGYGIRDVAGVEIVRANELFIQNGLIGFNAFFRTEGKLLDSKALKTLVCHA